jgi:hypothetical protein
MKSKSKNGRGSVTKRAPRLPKGPPKGAAELPPALVAELDALARGRVASAEQSVRVRRLRDAAIDAIDKLAAELASVGRSPTGDRDDAVAAIDLMCGPMPPTGMTGSQAAVIAVDERTIAPRMAWLHDVSVSEAGREVRRAIGRAMYGRAGRAGRADVSGRLRVTRSRARDAGRRSATRAAELARQPAAARGRFDDVIIPRKPTAEELREALEMGIALRIDEIGRIVSAMRRQSMSPNRAKASGAILAQLESEAEGLRLRLEELRQAR